MPFFRFILHGTGISLHGRGENTGERCGFYTTRSVYAATEQAARHRALAAVKRDWTVGPSARLSPGQPPTSLIIEEVFRIGFLGLWSAANKGNTLYIGPIDESARSDD